MEIIVIFSILISDIKEFVMLKKIILLFILIIFVSSGCANKTNKTNLYQSIIQKGKLVVGVSYDSKPFGFKDSDGQIRGIEPDLAREIARRVLGNNGKVVFKHVAPRDRIKAVTSGDVDMVISSMTITPQRKKIIDFSNPYFVAGQAICVKKTSKIDSYHDLNNKNVIVILGTTGENNLRSLEPNAIIQGYVNNADAFAAFKCDGNDAISTDDALLLGLAMENNNYKILPERLSKEPYGIAFKKSKNAASLKTNINIILNDMKRDGTLDTIKENWGVS